MPARFLRDPSIVSAVEWRDCEPDAPALPFESVILSGTFETDRWLPYPLGEVAGAPLTFVSRRAARLAPSGHFCGTVEDFSEGGEYLPDVPPTRYGSDGFPLCCGVPLPCRGGAGAGGRSPVVVSGSVTRGGAGASGRSEFTSDDGTDPTEGGVEVGGEAGDVWGFLDATEGGVEVGGEAGDVFLAVDPTEGGVEVGGEAGDVWSATVPALGGVEVGGEAGDQWSATVPALGGVEVGGEAGDDWLALPPALGGVEVGGEAGDVFTP